MVKRQPLEKSFAMGAVLLLVLVIGATMAVVHTQVRAVLQRGLADRGLAIAQSISAVSTPSLLAYNYPALQLAAEGAVEDSALAYVLIHDKEGSLAGIAKSVSSPARFPPLPDPFDGPTTRDVVLHDDEGAGKPVLEAVFPVLIDGVEEPWGTVRVGLHYDPVTAALRNLEAWLAVSGLLLTLFAAACSRWMARKITAPLRQLAEGTEALSKGDTAHRIPSSGAGELAEVTHAFNRMMDRVEEKAGESRAYENQLAMLNATLEEQVFERTRALEESEAQYRTLVEHSPDSILIVQGGRVRFVNRNFEETFRLSQKQALDPEFRVESVFEEGSARIVARRIRDWERGDPAPAVEVVALDADGHPRELELRGSRIEYLGRPAAECLLVDTTESKRLRSQLEDTERLRALGELASGVAHDFNNLLGAILGRIQLLRGRGFEPRIDREMAVIEKAARDGRETVRRIQDFSRTRADRPFTPLLLPGILRDAAEITRTRWKADAERRNVSIDVVLECEEVPPILGNATELREVFTNLILNAVDAMPRGGRVKLICRHNGDRVLARVEDDGAGMTEEIRRHLFDPFYTTKGRGGTGLGMSVAYGIITRHDGTVDVSSTLDEGTTFTLEFPACAPGTEVPPESPAAEPALALQGRVLVIDDELPIAQLLQDALTEGGHRVEIALSGSKGLEMAARNHYDVVLTDLGMPGMSGWEVARGIRAAAPELPVVLVTGWGMTISQSEVDGAGIAAVVHKPFEILDLLETVRNVLEHSHGGAQLVAAP
jgi:PAS domain S-box-containing protein